MEQGEERRSLFSAPGPAAAAGLQTGGQIVSGQWQPVGKDRRGHPCLLAAATDRSRSAAWTATAAS